jgi:hypothetical protein
MRRLLVAGIGVAILTVAGTGTLYLLRQHGLLALGPGVSGALPLERLAGGDTQPLARVLIAFLPAGAAAALLLPPLPRAARALFVAAIAVPALAFAGALSDAITSNDPLREHLHGQLSRGGPWIGAAVLALIAAARPAAGTGARSPRREASALP